MNKLAIVGGALTAVSIGLIINEARKRSGATPGPDISALDKTLLDQALTRIWMTKKALPKADMDRAYTIAINARMPKTAMTLRSIATDGKPGGPNYVMLPLDENWPGTNMSVRGYLTERVASLALQSRAA